MNSKLIDMINILLERLVDIECERRKLLKQLPDGMEHCTIQFKQCEKGHGWLTATNWIQHECSTCKADELRVEIEKLNEYIRRKN